MKVFFEDETIIYEELLDTMVKAANLACKMEGLDTEVCQLSVTFVGLDEIQELNSTYRGLDKPTDVLSFPQFEVEDLDFYVANPEETPDELMLGDVVICKEKAEEQAKEFGHSFERELIYLFTHSVLHLLGYDHEEPDEKAVMRKREEEIMDQLGIPRMN
jgi:probable rRNA maturation factor